MVQVFVKKWRVGSNKCASERMHLLSSDTKYPGWLTGNWKSTSLCIYSLTNSLTHSSIIYLFILNPHKYTLKQFHFNLWPMHINTRRANYKMSPQSSFCYTILALNEVQFLLLCTGSHLVRSWKASRVGPSKYFDVRLPGKFRIARQRNCLWMVLALKTPQGNHNTAVKMAKNKLSLIGLSETCTPWNNH